MGESPAPYRCAGVTRQCRLASFESESQTRTLQDGTRTLVGRGRQATPGSHPAKSSPPDAGARAGSPERGGVGMGVFQLQAQGSSLGPAASPRPLPGGNKAQSRLRSEERCQSAPREDEQREAGSLPGTVCSHQPTGREQVREKGSTGQRARAPCSLGFPV